MIKINSFDSYPYPAGTNRSKCTGRSSDSSPFVAPSQLFASGKECNKPKLFMKESGYTATGIVPDSHRIPFSLVGQQRGF